MHQLPLLLVVILCLIYVQNYKYGCDGETGDLYRILVGKAFGNRLRRIVGETLRIRGDGGLGQTVEFGGSSTEIAISANNI